jgi:hypothetical protein
MAEDNSDALGQQFLGLLPIDLTVAFNRPG